MQARGCRFGLVDEDWVKLTSRDRTSDGQGSTGHSIRRTIRKNLPVFKGGHWLRVGKKRQIERDQFDFSTQSTSTLFSVSGLQAKDEAAESSRVRHYGKPQREPRGGMPVSRATSPLCCSHELPLEPGPAPYACPCFGTFFFWQAVWGGSLVKLTGVGGCEGSD